MTAYTEWLPGPTQSEQYNSFEDAYGAFVPLLLHERVGSIGGSASLTWYIVSTTHGEGANPEWNVNYASTTGGHTATTHVRYNPTLLGTLDPAIPFGVETGIPQGILSVMTYAQLAGWISRLGSLATFLNTVLASFFTTICGMAASTTAMTATCTAIAYTDGSRAGGNAGVRCLLTYNPGVAELAGGVKQLAATLVGTVSDADDGTLNVFSGGSTLGEAVQNVPVIQFQGGDAESAWLEFTNAELEAADFAGFLGANTITHEDDLGNVDIPVVEPGEPDQRPIFTEAGAVNTLMLAPELIPMIPTPQGGALVAILAAGTWLSTWLSTGVFAALNGALSAISGGIATALTAIATGAGTIATGATGLISGSTSVRSSIEYLASNNASNALTTSTQEAATALQGIETDSTALVSAVSGIETVQASQAISQDRIADALERIADALEGDPEEDPPRGNLNEEIAKLTARLKDVADLSQTLVVKHKGTEFIATVGVIEP